MFVHNIVLILFQNLNFGKKKKSFRSSIEVRSRFPLVGRRIGQVGIRGVLTFGLRRTFFAEGPSTHVHNVMYKHMLTKINSSA